MSIAELSYATQLSHNMSEYGEVGKLWHEITTGNPARASKMRKVYDTYQENRTTKMAGKRETIIIIITLGHHINMI